MAEARYECRTARGITILYLPRSGDRYLIGADTDIVGPISHTNVLRGDTFIEDTLTLGDATNFIRIDGDVNQLRFGGSMQPTITTNILSHVKNFTTANDWAQQVDD